MNNIQEEFNNCVDNFQMVPGEYEGPLVINRTCRVDGGMSTLWSSCGPVLIIDAPAVEVTNLRVEVTGELDNKESRIAIKTSYTDTRLSGVEVSGDVVGIQNEPSTWNTPSVINLGDFAANKLNTFSYDLEVPVEAKLTCSLKDIKITPESLHSGINRIIIETGKIKDNSILYGDIFIVSAVSRRIYITGKAHKEAPEHHADFPVTGKLPVSEPLKIDTPQEIIAPSLPNPTIFNVSRGQRISIKEIQSKVLKVVYEQRNSQQKMEIDCYAFLLKEDGKVHADSDLIFFGNDESNNGEVKVISGSDPVIALIDLNRVQEWVKKIAICYSIYGDNPDDNFAKVDLPSIRIFAGEREFCRFELGNLSEEKTVVALEIYQYKGEWKANFVGSGYRNGLRILCEGYGVDVE